MEEITDMGSFLEVSNRYLANARPLGIDGMIWLVFLIIFIIAIATWLWLRKKKERT